MNQLRIKLSFITALVLVWIALTGIPEDMEHIMLAISCITFVACICFWLDIIPRKFAFNYKALIYIFWLIKEIIKSSIAVSKLAISKNSNLNPSIDWLKVKDSSNLSSIIFANSITLTPGTITILLENNKLLVHALDKSSLEDLKTGIMRDKIVSIIC